MCLCMCTCVYVCVCTRASVCVSLSHSHALSLSQVCEVYKLHRETFYLGQDYFDRFMATQKNVQKSTLQLIGISALFIAAKMEVCRSNDCNNNENSILLALSTVFTSFVLHAD